MKILSDQYYGVLKSLGVISATWVIVLMGPLADAVLTGVAISNELLATHNLAAEYFS